MDKFLKNTVTDVNSKNLFILFLVLTFVLNLLQSYFTGLHPDEAYYWIYSKFLDWGYFDHPPMVALFIKGGYAIFQNTLGLRLITVISNLGALIILYQIVKKYNQNVPLFILMVSAVLMFHVYAFITTPDVPLFFFTILFLYLYQIYLKEDKLYWAILLGLVCGALMMSKYHGILVIFFVLISNLNLFKRKSFYLVISLGILICLPHLYWQYLNNFPSFYYHIIDRSATPYRFDYTSQYFLDQLLMMGPLVGWLFFYYGFKVKSKPDAFLRSLKFILYGVLIFFFISTFKGRVQAQWPLIEFIALFILAYVYASNNTAHVSKFKWLFGINIFLIILARLIIMGFIPAANKIKFVAEFQNYDVWANQLKEVTENKPVIFLDGFQKASYYNFYTRSLKADAYNSIAYRQTQYDLWPLENEIQGKSVFLIEDGKATGKNQQTVKTIKGAYHLTLINHVRFYPKIYFDPINFPKQWDKNETRLVAFTIRNPYQKTVSFSDDDQEWKCSFQYGLMQNGKMISLSALPDSLKAISLKANETKKVNLNIKSPNKAGDYKLFISIKTKPFKGTRNSKMISLKVK
ncbi:glycosyltransferase family 39 protein [Pedobacter sp. SD-b]|uniref:Glycosyltransferase family 39 protein n=1 Tax=Pedobacter segetis TaxID=2793069 RepID=A0ABS1BK38_9SPHI|nr:glycosyltransferase family 39 protein [Pedobacter segetis]MBK0383168.1 glycosyltransferase family 39 protein [Pedobacter segetis]